jgi:nucleoside-diphosphate-sugar epimerase
MASRRVVITGAGGLIGRSIDPLLPEAWEVTRTDRRRSAGIDALDVTDVGACRRAFDGADAVVHLAAVPDPAATWEQLREPNVQGVVAVAQAAVDCLVRRLVLASSLQAVSAPPSTVQRRAADPPRPANLYGATKAFAEAVGSWVAATSATSVVALRIGYFSLTAPGPDATPRDRAAWLSSRDAAELVRAAVEADVVGLVVANGISANTYRAADIDETIAELGYRPADDAWGDPPAG